ncbi:MAG: hypothetical protein H0W88_00080 [Parachlamydiaceae bacterium]|nr:hypothetical protein [Parachlamydiaceae bacterium]
MNLFNPLLTELTLVNNQSANVNTLISSFVGSDWIGWSFVKSTQKSKTKNIDKVFKDSLLNENMEEGIKALQLGASPEITAAEFIVLLEGRKERSLHFVLTQLKSNNKLSKVFGVFKSMVVKLPMESEHFSKGVEHLLRTSPFDYESEFQQSALNRKNENVKNMLVLFKGNIYVDTKPIKEKEKIVTTKPKVEYKTSQVLGSLRFVFILPYFGTQYGS